MQTDPLILQPSAHAAKGVVLQHVPDARAFYVGDGEWEVYTSANGDDTQVIGSGGSLALAWGEACLHVESVMGASL